MTVNYQPQQPMDNKLFNNQAQGLCICSLNKLFNCYNGKGSKYVILRHLSDKGIHLIKDV